MSAPFMIAQNIDDVGEFYPCKVNTNSYNFALSIFNKNNIDDNNSIFSMDYDGASDSYFSFVTNDSNTIDFNMFSSDKCRLTFVGDFKSDEVISVDVYGTLVFMGDVKNVIFNLKNKNAKVEIMGEKLINTKILDFKE